MKNQTLQKVEITSGLFKGCQGVVNGTFKHNGIDLLSVRVPKQMMDGEIYYTGATVRPDQVKNIQTSSRLIEILSKDGKILVHNPHP